MSEGDLNDEEDDDDDDDLEKVRRKDATMMIGCLVLG